MAIAKHARIVDRPMHEQINLLTLGSVRDNIRMKGSSRGNNSITRESIFWRINAVPETPNDRKAFRGSPTLILKEDRYRWPIPFWAWLYSINRDPSAFVQVHRFGGGRNGVMSLSNGLPRLTHLLSSVVSVETENNQSEESDEVADRPGPMLTPKFSKTTAQWAALVFGLCIPILFCVFIWFIYSSVTGVDERNSIIAAKIGAALGAFVLNYPLVHVILDLLDFHRVYLRDLL